MTIINVQSLSKEQLYQLIVIALLLWVLFDIAVYRSWLYEEGAYNLKNCCECPDNWNFTWD